MSDSVFSHLLNVDSVVIIMGLLTYYILLKSTSSKQAKIALILFLLLSVFVKSHLPLIAIRDFFTYNRVLIDKGKMGIRIEDVIFEPYFLLLSKMLLKWLSILQVLKIYYFILFMLAIAFFSWLAFLKDLSLWKKYLIFNLFFILFSFILLRNGIAYMMLAFFFYYLSKNRYFIFCFSAIIFHITSFPVLFLSFFRKKKLNLFILPLAIIFILLFAYLFYDSSSIFYLKFKDFKKNAAGYNYPIHTLVFIMTLSIFIGYFIYFKSLLNNYYYILLIFIYVILYYFNSVMGFRFSFYIILYLIMNTKLILNSRIENALNRYSFLFIIIGIITVKLFLYN